MYAQVQEKKIPILLYHSISYTDNARIRPWTVSPELFAEQMTYLHQHAYTPITVTEFVKARFQKATSLPARPVVLTFDDGFADFFIAALPVLKQYDFTATLYVSTAFIDGTSRWLLRERETTRPMLTWKQLAEINASCIECGTHSHSHPQLDTLPSSAARDEIVRSKELLEDHLGQEVTSFAYPFGYYSATIRRMVREAGYTSACAFKHAMSSETDDVFALSRLGVDPDSNIAEFASLLADRGSSPEKAAYKMYRRARTLVWRFVRRCKVSGTRYLKVGQLE